MLATAHHADCRFLPPTVDLHTNHHNRPDTDTTLSTFRIYPEDGGWLEVAVGVFRYGRSASNANWILV